MAHEVMRYPVNELTMTQAEQGDAEKALALYAFYSHDMNDTVAADYWLKVAAMHGSYQAITIFAGNFYKLNDFNKSLSKRWLKSIMLTDRPIDQLAKIYYLKGEIYINENQNQALTFYAYAAYLESNGAYKVSLIEECSKLGKYSCLFVWSNYLFAGMKPNMSYYKRLQDMKTEASTNLTEADIEELNGIIEKIKNHESDDVEKKIKTVDEVMGSLLRNNE